MTSSKERALWATYIDQKSSAHKYARVRAHMKSDMITSLRKGIMSTRGEMCFGGVQRSGMSLEIWCEGPAHVATMYIAWA